MLQFSSVSIPLVCCDIIEDLLLPSASHNLGEAVFHQYHNIQFSTRLRYTYIPYISNFMYLYLLSSLPMLFYI